MPSATDVPLRLGPGSDELRRLLPVRGFPCVSLLTNVDHGGRLAPAAVERLVDTARRRLRSVLDASATDHYVDRLRALVPPGVDPVHRAVGVFVGPDAGFVVPVAVPVTDRVVIADTFATRDLVRAAQRVPAYWLIAADRDRWALGAGRGATIEWVDGGALDDGSPARLAAHCGAVPPDDSEPILVVGAAAYDVVELAGLTVPVLVLPWSSPAAHPHDPAIGVWPVVEAMHRRGLLATVDALRAARRQRRLVYGLTPVRNAVLDGAVELLAVDDDHHVVAVASRDTPGDTDIVDDVVDDLVELAIDRGVRVVFAPCGLLPDELGAPLVALRPATSGAG